MQILALCLAVLVPPLSPALPQKGADGAAYVQTFHVLEVDGSAQRLAGFGGSTRRAALASGGTAKAVVKPAPQPCTLMFHLPATAPLCSALEASFTGGAPQVPWTVREVDAAGNEVLVHELEGARVGRLELPGFDPASKDAPRWTLRLDVERTDFKAGSGKAEKSASGAKLAKSLGVRVLFDGVEIQPLRRMDGVQIDFGAANVGGTSTSRSMANAAVASPLKLAIGGHDVAPWLARLDGKSGRLEIQYLDSADPKAATRAKLSFEHAVVTAVTRPGDAGRDELELEFQGASPRLSFTPAP